MVSTRAKALTPASSVMARPADHEARSMEVIGKVILIFTLKTETTMKKSILCLLFAIAAMAWANDAAAQQCKKKVTPRVESTVPKGKMPPRWLLNKVTPAQYDTLVALNRLCTVDYSMLKGYKVTPQMVEKVMGQARKYIREAMDRHDGVVPRVGWTALVTKTLTTWSDKTEKGTRTVEYLVGSSADGYDVHLLLRATLQRDRQTGGYRSVAYELVPYSVQGMPVEVKSPRVYAGGTAPVAQLEWGKDGKSPYYAVNATLDFTDPLGAKHREQINVSVALCLGR